MMLTPEQEDLKRLALAADQGEGQHIYTSWRDSNNSDANDAWHKAASPAAILALLAQIEAMP